MIRDIDNTKMPLLEHLVELRTRLVRCAIVVVLAFLPCFYFAQDIYNFLARPLYDVSYNQECGGGGGAVEWVDGFLYANFNFHLIDDPSPVVPEEPCTDVAEQLIRIIYTSPAEAFLTLVKVGFFVSLCITLPFIAIQIWGFVAPGLYRKEKRVVLPFMIGFPFLFTLGAAMVYYAFFPVALEFLLSFQQAPTETGQLEITPEFKVSEYFSFLLKLIFAFGISFQLPLIIYFLARTGMATSAGLREKRKYAIVAVFVLAAIITPPDPFSQLGLAIPLLLLYEISIWVARLVEKGKVADAAAEEAEGDAEPPVEPAGDDFVEETDFNPAR